jgi:hypothetical protein
MSTSNRIPVHDRAAIGLVSPEHKTVFRSWLCNLKGRFAKFAFGIWFTDARLNALSNLAPRHFGESDIAKIFGVSHSSARRLCRAAVRRGVLDVRCERPLGPKNVYSLSESQESEEINGTDNSVLRNK